MEVLKSIISAFRLLCCARICILSASTPLAATSSEKTTVLALCVQFPAMEC
jgi:hypothetical protein